MGEQGAERVPCFPLFVDTAKSELHCVSSILTLARDAQPEVRYVE